MAIAAGLALLLQVVLPLPGITLLTPGNICHAATGDDGDRAPQPLPGQGCDHCLLCHAGNFSAVLPPPAPRLAAPAVTAIPAAWLPDGGRRGAARPAYASRAPPTIG